MQPNVAYNFPAAEYFDQGIEILIYAIHDNLHVFKDLISNFELLEDLLMNFNL